MRARPATALVAALVLGALVLGACGGGDDAGEAATATTVASPLAALLGFSTDPADQEAQQQRFIDQEREVQQQ
ncbi:MAG: sugar ABC transporter substrate-binding protein, partial [Acidimicrobiia bacterium]